MATYAIGDIQGCFNSFKRLLGTIQFDSARDRLWLCGDLVNRGPTSLQVLRWAVDHDASVISVLGNHDLFLLACAYGLASPRAADTLDDILHAPDRDDLLHWLATRPLLHCQDDWLLVHAGILPVWDMAQARSNANEVEQALRRGIDLSWLAMGQHAASTWDNNLSGSERLATIAASFTCLRCVDNTELGHIDRRFTGPLDALPDGLQPWWRARRWNPRDPRIIFGHWAAVGVHREGQITAQDSGCVWGRQLSALRLDDEAVISHPCVENAVTLV